jgi:radical SAM protein with 4Fe4S-binding SPASM domain
MKDGLFNIILYRDGNSFGGCTGFGCGAAFNFLALLADGEVHACRKFPSLLGSILDNSLAEIYDSAAARRYREGSAGCGGCPLKPVCGGCQAISASYGREPSTARDPFCFRPETLWKGEGGTRSGGARP